MRSHAPCSMCLRASSPDAATLTSKSGLRSARLSAMSSATVASSSTKRTRFFLMVISECSLSSISGIQVRVSYAVLQFRKGCITNAHGKQDNAAQYRQEDEQAEQGIAKLVGNEFEHERLLKRLAESSVQRARS